MSSSLGIRLSSLFAVAVLFSPHAALAEPAPLPLKRVRLYETGVGYFERTGPIAGRGVGLPVPAGHLDDALKTLVVLSDDPSTQVGGIEFSSSLSPALARSLAGLPPPEAPAPLGLQTLLRGLRGSNVEIQASGGRIVGRLVEVVDPSQEDIEVCAGEARDGAPPADASGSRPVPPCTLKRQSSIVVLGPGGDIRRVPLDAVKSVRPTEPELARRIGAALDAFSDRSARVQKELEVQARGKKDVTLGYVAETPVWRANYRLVFGKAKGATLQGWALLHNDTDEAWRGVRVEIVNGQPDSFLFPLAAPRYARRELVAPTEQLWSLPQLGSTTVDNIYGAEIGEAFGAGGFGLVGIGSGGGGSGEGFGRGAGGVSHTVRTPSLRVSVGNLAQVSGASGIEVGALFRFTLAEPVDLRAHGSVLAPFVGEAVDATRIALFQWAGGPARSAVVLTHRGAQTLPSGTIAVFADDGFAGEAILMRMKPSQTQIVEFGNDLDVTLVEREHREADQTRLLAFEGDALVEHFVRSHSIEYEIENKSGSERLVSVGLPFVNNSKVEGAERLVYDAPSERVYAGFTVPKQSLEKRSLSATEGLMSRHARNLLDTHTWQRLLGQSKLPAKQKKIVTDLHALSLARARAVRNRDGWRAVLKERTQEADRLRANAQAVGPSASEDIAKRLLAVEDEMKVLKRRVAVFATKVGDADRRTLEMLKRL
jgi:hypothetical protein